MEDGNRHPDLSRHREGKLVRNYATANSGEKFAPLPHSRKKKRGVQFKLLEAPPRLERFAKEIRPTDTSLAMRVKVLRQPDDGLDPGHGNKAVISIDPARRRLAVLASSCRPCVSLPGICQDDAVVASVALN